MPHLDDRLLVPDDWMRVLDAPFPIQLRPYPGKPIVCMIEREDGRAMQFGDKAITFELPPEVADKYLPDFGVVVGFKPRLDGEGKITHPQDLLLKVGMVVAVKPYTGNWYDHSGFDWIPRGRWLKILGTVEDWTHNILAAVDLSDDLHAKGHL